MTNDITELSEQDKIILARLEAQFHSIRASISKTDEKARHIITLLNGIAAIYATAHLVLANEISLADDGLLQLALVLTFGLTYMAMMFLFVQINLPQWQSVGVIQSDWENIWEWRTYAGEEFLNRLLSQYVYENAENLRIAAGKTRILRHLYMLLSAAIGILILEIVFQFLGRLAIVSF